MLATSLTMMIRLLLLVYLPNWQEKLPLLIADIIILTMTAGILILTAKKWLNMRKNKKFL